MKDLTEQIRQKVEDSGGFELTREQQTQLIREGVAKGVSDGMTTWLDGKWNKFNEGFTKWVLRLVATTLFLFLAWLMVHTGWVKVGDPK